MSKLIYLNFVITIAALVWVGVLWEKVKKQERALFYAGQMADAEHKFLVFTTDQLNSQVDRDFNSAMDTIEKTENVLMDASEKIQSMDRREWQVKIAELESKLDQINGAVKARSYADTIEASQRGLDQEHIVLAVTEAAQATTEASKALQASQQAQQIQNLMPVYDWRPIFDPFQPTRATIQNWGDGYSTVDFH